MCECGDTVKLILCIPAHLSSTGREKEKLCNIDRCIVGTVQKLNQGGLITIASCCGHGKRPGSIILADGRELIIAKDYEEGRKIDKIFNENGYSPIN